MLQAMKYSSRDLSIERMGWTTLQATKSRRQVIVPKEDHTYGILDKSTTGPYS